MLTLAACALPGLPGPAAVSGAPAASETPTPAASPSPLPPGGAPTSAPDVSITATPTPAPTAAPTRPVSPTPLPTLSLPARLPPEMWKDWPITPGVTNAARVIYAKGMALGRNPRAFSKVADCQGIKEVLMGLYDQPGVYKLPAAAAARLQETIDWFAGSFNRDGFAVMGGFNARAVLDPAVADPSSCAPGEAPIACEFRRHNPSIVIISLEFYYEGRSAAAYSAHLRQSIEYFTARGVVPILATKADNAEGDESINLATARLAAEYDLPLWNFWRAAQGLPNFGMDPARPDGFHISPDAWLERSATALWALDSVWRGVRDLAPAPAAAAAPQGGTPTPQGGTSTPTSPAPSLQAVVGLAQASASGGVGGPVPRGVHLLDIKAQSLTRLLPDEYALQAVSPAGDRLLVNRGAALAVSARDGTGLRAVSESFYAHSRQGAAWLADGSGILFIAESGGARSVWLAGPNGENPRRIVNGAGADQPFELAPGPTAAVFYWAAGECRSEGECAVTAWYASGADGAGPALQARLRSPLLAPNGRGLAYTYTSEKGLPVLAVTTDTPSVPGALWTPLPEGMLGDYAWSPSGRWLAAVWQERSDYSGKLTMQKVYVLNPTSGQKDSVLMPVTLNCRVRWSPDGRWILVMGTEPVSGGYRTAARLLPVGGGPAQVFDGKMGSTTPGFIYISAVEWISNR